MNKEKTIVSILNNRIFQHSIFWMAYVVVFGLLYGRYEDDYFFYFKESFYMIPFMMTAAYLIIYGILPGFFKSRKFIFILIYSFLILIVVVFLQRITLRIVNELDINFKKLFDLTFLYMFLETSFMVGVAIVIKLLKKSAEHQHEKLEIEKQNLQAELKLLKAQIEPHFLFNTMNNLYALSLDQSVKTSEGIAKISELLSIILYECNEQYIKLDKEVCLLRNYIDLEKLRYDKRLKIEFEVEGELRGKEVAPMLFITFLENCFKHGSSSDSNSPWIKVSIKVDDKKIRFRAENSVTNEKQQKIKQKDTSIGLHNVKRRLDLLYKDAHDLKIEQVKDRFIVELNLQTV